MRLNRKFIIYRYSRLLDPTIPLTMKKCIRKKEEDATPEATPEVDRKEDWLKPGIFCLTINPNDSLQELNHRPTTKLGRITKIRAHLYDILLDFPDVMIMLETEISMPNNTGFSMSTCHTKYPRVHFHGVIELKTNKAIKYLLEYGFWKLSQYSVNLTEFKKLVDGSPDVAGWTKYILKQHSIMDETCMKIDRTVSTKRKERTIRDMLLDEEDTEVDSEEFLDIDMHESNL